MTTPTTPYALWQHVPLSECREIMAKLRLPRTEIERLYLQRALAAVTASRDQLQDHLEGTIEAHKADIRRYNEMAAQLKAVTAERDALRRELDAMTGEL